MSKETIRMSICFDAERNDFSLDVPDHQEKNITVNRDFYKRYNKIKREYEEMQYELGDLHDE